MCRLLSMATALGVLLVGFTCHADPIRVISWNLESGNADPEFVAERIAGHNGYDIWGFSEVNADDAATFVIAAAEGENASFDHRLGQTGAGDRLLLVWDAERFENIAEEELMNLRLGGGRAPLAVRLRESATRTEFWVMVNHLHRGSASKRNKQAAGVRDWIKAQHLPVFAVGDYNMDYDVPDGPGNTAFDICTKATTCSGSCRRSSRGQRTAITACSTSYS